MPQLQRKSVPQRGAFYFLFSEIELNQRDNSTVIVKIFAFWQFRKKANKYVDQSEESRNDLVNHGRGSN
jgi:hypothetical protein